MSAAVTSIVAGCVSVTNRMSPEFVDAFRSEPEMASTFIVRVAIDAADVPAAVAMTLFAMSM